MTVTFVILVAFVVITAVNWVRWRDDRALALRLREARGDRPRLEDLRAPVPKVSVLVAAWNETKIISQHVGSFLNLRYPNKELILCAGGGDGTYDIARGYAGEAVIVFEQQPGEGKQAALRRCLHQAQGQIIYLTDADGVLDDDSFERTLEPLIADGEAASSGACQPMAEQQSRPFVVHQWCTDLYVQAHAPDHISGLQGANCAIRRHALEAAGAFAPDVRTGTDYHLAKRLLRTGYRIRWVRDSAVHTRYPDTRRSYWRRQSRWVRNLVVHGPAFGAQAEVRLAFRTGVVGLAMLGLPLGAALAVARGARGAAGWLLVVWSAALWHSILARLRYLGFGRLYRGVEIPWSQHTLIPLHMFVDFVAWVAPLVDRVLRPQQW